MNGRTTCLLALLLSSCGDLSQDETLRESLGYDGAPQVLLAVYHADFARDRNDKVNNPHFVGTTAEGHRRSYSNGDIALDTVSTSYREILRRQVAVRPGDTLLATCHLRVSEDDGTRTSIYHHVAFNGSSSRSLSGRQSVVRHSSPVGNGNHHMLMQSTGLFHAAKARRVNVACRARLCKASFVGIDPASFLLIEHYRAADKANGLVLGDLLSLGRKNETRVTYNEASLPLQTRMRTLSKGTVKIRKGADNGVILAGAHLVTKPLNDGREVMSAARLNFFEDGKMYRGASASENISVTSRQVHFSLLGAFPLKGLDPIGVSLTAHGNNKTRGFHASSTGQSLSALLFHDPGAADEGERYLVLSAMHRGQPVMTSKTETLTLKRVPVSLQAEDIVRIAAQATFKSSITGRCSLRSVIEDQDNNVVHRGPMNLRGVSGVLPHAMMRAEHFYQAKRALQGYIALRMRCTARVSVGQSGMIVSLYR